MIFDLYWQYFIAGVIIYLITKLVVWYFQKSVKSDGKSADGKPETSEDSDCENDYDDSILPALDPNLQHVPLHFKRLSFDESLRTSSEFYELMNKRRSVRHFSKETFPVEIMHNIIKTAGSAPSGAHTEPWTFVLVSSAEVKQKVREIIEEEEEINYRKRMGKVWTTDLRPLKTNWIKEYLTDVPYLILVFKQVYSVREDGKKKLHYYNEQSVSIAVGILLSAIHNAGLTSLISTPLNCGPALRGLLNRPASEKLTILLPVGYPAEDCKIPDLKRKSLDEILVEF